MMPPRDIRLPDERGFKDVRDRTWIEGRAIDVFDPGI